MRRSGLSAGPRGWIGQACARAHFCVAAPHRGAHHRDGPKGEPDATTASDVVVALAASPQHSAEQGGRGRRWSLISSAAPGVGHLRWWLQLSSWFQQIGLLP